MAAGAAAGLAAAYICYPVLILPFARQAGAFIIGLMAFAGVAAGRILSSWWANKHLEKLLAVLYRQQDPETFLMKFAPIVKKTPVNTAEYCSGIHHLAYAYEAMGSYDTALDLMNQAEPEKLKLHRLVCCAVAANQKMRLYLLKEDKEEARHWLEELRGMEECAKLRAPAVGKNLSACIRLGEVWLGCLDGNRDGRPYIEEEARLAENWIHKKEMESLLESLSA